MVRFRLCFLAREGCFELRCRRLRGEELHAVRDLVEPEYRQRRTIIAFQIIRPWLEGLGLRVSNVLGLGFRVWMVGGMREGLMCFVLCRICYKDKADEF